MHDTVIELALDRAELATSGWVGDPVRPSRAYKVQKGLLQAYLKATPTADSATVGTGMDNRGDDHRDVRPRRPDR